MADDGRDELECRAVGRAVAGAAVESEAAEAHYGDVGAEASASQPSPTEMVAAGIGKGALADESAGVEGVVGVGA